jgi:hypothetical protein
MRELSRPLPSAPMRVPTKNQTISRPEITITISPTIRLWNGFPSPTTDRFPLIPDRTRHHWTSPTTSNGPGPNLGFLATYQTLPPEPLLLQEVAVSPQWKAKNSFFESIAKRSGSRRQTSDAAPFHWPVLDMLSGSIPSVPPWIRLLAEGLDQPHSLYGDIFGLPYRVLPFWTMWGLPQRGH